VGDAENVQNNIGHFDSGKTRQGYVTFVKPKDACRYLFAA
jgi:hypothetical protein